MLRFVSFVYVTGSKNYFKCKYIFIYVYVWYVHSSSAFVCFVYRLTIIVASAHSAPIDPIQSRHTLPHSLSFRSLSLCLAATLTVVFSVSQSFSGPGFRHSGTRSHTRHTFIRTASLVDVVLEYQLHVAGTAVQRRRTERTDGLEAVRAVRNVHICPVPDIRRVGRAHTRRNT